MLSLKVGLAYEEKILSNFQAEKNIKPFEA